MQNSPARSGVDVGSVIADTYTIEALIGRGGMGAVFLASHKRLPGKKVAIKMLHAELSGDEVLARFRREAEIASRLGHPNIVAVHDFNVLPDGTPYLVLEYLQGESLAQRLKAGPLTVEHAMSILRQIGSALAAAHREGIVHRDLKPQNIFLVPTEVDGRVVEIAKVLDFGISKIRGSQTVKTQESTLLGTPQYMAPEQATGQHASVDERTDVFALGAIVYEMLAGHPAFDGASIPEVVFKVVYEQPKPLAGEVPSLPAAIAAAVQQAMAKNAADRFATVGNFIEALTGQPLTVIRPPAPALGEGGPGSGSHAKSSGNDAFAQTMGSGDHGTVAPPAGPAVRGSAPTVASQSGQPVPDPVRRRRTTVIVACSIGGAAIAAVALVFAMRGDRPGHPPAVDRLADRERAKVPDRPAPPERESPPPPEPVKPERANVEPARPDPKLGPAKPEGKQAHAGRQEPAKPSSGDGDDAGADETAKQLLAQAELALRANNPDAVEQLANKIINSEYAIPFQKMHAHTLHGIVACNAHNNQETAQADLRRIKAPRLRKRLIESCRQAGVAIVDQ